MVQIKLRMQDGDVGPLEQPNSDTVGDLKSRLVSDWAKLHAGRTGPLPEPPPSIAEVKLILNGKFLDNDMSLGEVYNSLQEPGDESVITLLAVVRQQPTQKAQAMSKGKNSQRCGCVIC